MSISTIIRLGISQLLKVSISCGGFYIFLLHNYIECMPLAYHAKSRSSVVTSKTSSTKAELEPNPTTHVANLKPPRFWRSRNHPHHLETITSQLLAPFLSPLVHAMHPHFGGSTTTPSAYQTRTYHHDDGQLPPVISARCTTTS